MTGLHPYCVAPAGEGRPIDVLGLSDRPVHAHRVGPFDVWVSHEASPPALDLAGVKRHHQVVVAAMSLATAVPVRFGAWAPDARVLEQRVLARREEIEAAADRVRDKVEFGVRVEERSIRSTLEEPGAPQDGRGYLRRLSRVHAARRGRRTLQADLAHRLDSCVRAVRCDERVLLLDAPGLIATAHLVGRGDEERYRESVEEFVRDARSSYRVHVTGPWPPYSFAS